MSYRVVESSYQNSMACRNIFYDCQSSPAETGKSCLVEKLADKAVGVVGSNFSSSGANWQDLTDWAGVQE